jgi:hypothetical protein
MRARAGRRVLAGRRGRSHRKRLLDIAVLAGVFVLLVGVAARLYPRLAE